MKGLCEICLVSLPCLLILFTSKGFCQQHCQWGPFEEWSECDGCTKTQTRSRSMSVYPTPGGRPCDGARIEVRSCETTKSCPLSHGCGERFRCRSGMCISQSLKCNGDQDCEEDQEDERSCERKQHFVCQIQRPPPNIELLGVGIDIATGKSRGLVINTKSFGGQCRKIDNNAYRLPEGLLMYTNLVKVQNDLNDEMFETEWHYAKDIVKRETVSGTASGYRNYDYHETDVRKRRFHLMVLQNDIEIATFQSNSPKYIPIAEEFWKALIKLPTVYNYGAYRKVLEQFGTHYISEGALGGSLKVIARLDHDERTNKIIEQRSHNVCTKTKRFILFFPIYHTSCDHDAKDTSRNPHDYKNTITVGKVYTEGGSTALQAQLQELHSTKPEDNWKIYTDWAASVRSFPKVIKQKLRPLSELVKEVHCAGVKKLYLRKAIEKYLYETDPCNCSPCGRNGVSVIENYECRCIVKPGSEAEDPNRMEIDGNWACWSVWGPCSGGRRSRSRSCTNPPPQNGGQHCVGKSSEMGECEEEELQYLRNFEPECFDMTLPPSLKCGPPPALINGYVLDPKDIYLEGHRVEYRCISGFHVSGQSTLECSASQTWSGTLGVCQLSNCMMPLLPAGLKVSPDKNTYPIGDSVTLSCPEGKELQGEAESICDASLNFSPDPTLVTCKQVNTGPDTGSTSTTVQCKVWEKEAKGKCICKLPYECGDSLELCASNPIIGQAAVVTVCKMHALKCMKKDLALAEDSLCDWSMQTASRTCSKCHMWETCDGQTNTCVCRASSNCSSPGLSVCVRAGEDPAAAPQTMSECEAGLRRCRGDKVTVVKIVPCSA